MTRRILVCEQHFVEGFGGTPESVLLLAKHLVELDIEIDVVCSEGLIRSVQRLSQLPAEEEKTAFQPSSDLDLQDYAALFIVGSWNPKAVPLAWRARAAGLPISYAAKGNLCGIEFSRLRDAKKVPYFLCLEAMLLLLSKNIVCSSRHERDAFIVPKEIWRKKCQIVAEPFNGPPLEPIDPAALGDDRDGLTFGFLAEISPRKGLAELVKGYMAWLDHRPPFATQLHIAGQCRPGSESYEAAIRGMVAASRYKDRIIWRGPLRGEARNRFYQEIDVFICPSRFESFGLTPLEALWQGVPVMVCSNMGVVEYLPAEAPAIVMADLSQAQMIRAFDRVGRERNQLAEAARAYRGRKICGLAGRELSARFVHILLSNDSREISRP